MSACGPQKQSFYIDLWKDERRLKDERVFSSPPASRGSRRIGRPITKWTDSTGHSAVHADVVVYIGAV
eukprot:5957884-Pyramimonas_sp.AAC.1